MSNLFQNPDCLSFLAAIRAAADDDAPRLIFSDWLEENGEEEWAEYIRLSLRFQRDQLSEGEVQAFDEKVFRKGFAWMLPDADPHVRWERGFVKEVTCYVQDWLKFADRLSLHPLRVVQVTRFPEMKQLIANEFYTEIVDSWSGTKWWCLYGRESCKFTSHQLGEKLKEINCGWAYIPILKALMHLTWPEVPFDFTVAVQAREKDELMVSRIEA